MRIRRLFAAVVATIALQSIGALAAAPSNDTIGGATPIGTLPFAETIDTTEATTDAEDAGLNASCGAPATDASVWYSLVGTGADILVDVFGSNYTAGVLVGVGTPGSLVTVSCGPGATAFHAEAGTTYYILAIDDQGDGTGNGGQLQISVDVAPPAPEITITVDGTGTVTPKTGIATVSGTVTCTGTNVQFAEVYGELRQRAGRSIIRGWFDAEMICDGASHPWTAEVQPENGYFAGGKATVLAEGFACDIFSCGHNSTYEAVRLRSSRR